MWKICVLTIHISLFLGSINVIAQNKTIDINTRKFSLQERKDFNKAEELYADLNYEEASFLYQNLSDQHPKEHYINYRLGKCYLNAHENIDKAVKYLQIVEQKHPNSADVKYFLGKAYHLTYQFDEALNILYEYKKQKIIKNQEELTNQLIQYCINAKDLSSKPLDVNIVNIGPPVNSNEAEYVPLVSVDENEMIFTYRGSRSIEGLEDIYRTKKDKKGEWLVPESIGDNINGADNDACIALSPDGQTLFVYRDTKNKKGEIYYSKLKGTEWSTPKPLMGEINTNHWEGSASLSLDGKTIYFSSDKPSGYGGRDIYKATLMDNNVWGNIENLGETINTPYNDDAPFIHADGETLIFSSEGHNSMGDYDIFYTKAIAEGVWEEPTNIGYPINSPGRDTYYTLSVDGKTGYFSSGRLGGNGSQDIYSVQPGLKGYTSKVAMIKGKVTLNDHPVEAIVTINNKEGFYKKLNSNSASGDYIAMLPTGKEYQIEYRLKDIDYALLKGDSVFMETMFIKDGETFIELNKNAPFYTKGFVKEFPLLSSESTHLEEMSLDDILFNYGDKYLEGLLFKVQIAAYSIPNNYDYANLKGLGEIEKNVMEDNITRFTIGGGFKTLREAINHKEKVIARGQEDAFVTVIYKGKRSYLKDLINLGILQK